LVGWLGLGLVLKEGSVLQLKIRTSIKLVSRKKKPVFSQKNCTNKMIFSKNIAFSL
jgi:hypothetical protein